MTNSYPMVGKNLLTPKPIRLEGGDGEYFSRCMLEGVVTLMMSLLSSATGHA